MKKIWALAATLSLLAACSPEISWTEGPTGADGRAVQTLTLKNMPAGARIWFQEMFDNHEMVEGPVSEIHHFQGTTFWFDVPEGAGREFTVQYKGRPLPRRSWAPEGFVLQENGPLCCALQAVEVMGRDHSVVSTHPAARSAVIRSIIPSEETPQVKSGSVRFRLKPFKTYLFDAGTGERIPFSAV